MHDIIVVWAFFPSSGLSYRKGRELSEDFHVSSFKLPHQQLPAQL